MCVYVFHLSAPEEGLEAWGLEHLTEDTPNLLGTYYRHHHCVQGEFITEQGVLGMEDKNNRPQIA